MATDIAIILRGKNKPDFTPNIDAGDFVVVINSDMLKVTGKKMEFKSELPKDMRRLVERLRLRG